MDLAKIKVELEGLPEAELRLLVAVAFMELSEDRPEYLVRLAGQMKRVNEQDKKGG